MNDLATQKLKKYIEEMREFSAYLLPEFKRTTKQEASDYIKKYWRLAHESNYGITHGY